jgi:SAM-dependent methyltransferase
MSKLYTNLANVYHEIYQTLFDYDEEFEFYDQHLKANKIESIVEIGCGTGNLAKRLVEANYAYLGLDIFQEMLAIAAKNAPKATFMQGDVRNFSLTQSSDCALITGRSISYLTSNQDILQAFQCINRCLKPNGLLMFDAIDAAKLLTNFEEDKTNELLASFGTNHYKRLSKNQLNLSTGWTWNWTSVYYKQNEAQIFEEIGQDFSTLRAFTADELSLFLALSGFELVRILPKKSYAWEDNFYMAQKK